MSMEPPPFQAFLDGHRHDVYRYLAGLVGPVDADDCFQETFLAALRAYPRLRDASNLRSWVLTIAHRKGIDALRARARRPEPRAEVPETAGTHAGTEPELWDAVRDLAPGQRAAVVLRYAWDLPYRDIGRIVRCSEAAARRRVHDGLRRLREVLPA